MNARSGTLYIVATPIGNIDDISLRARKVLADVSVVAAEDTRRSGKLLERLGIKTRMVSCHEHNEIERVPELLAQLEQGDDVALVSDAGTPLVSDPGYRLVIGAVAANITVSPIPGCNAAIAAASVSALPTDQMLFVGFLPQSSAKRQARLTELRDISATLLIYEAVHRVRATLEDIAKVLGKDRQIVAARELTKLHEQLYRGTVEEVIAQTAVDGNANKGEYTLVIAGSDAPPPDSAELDKVLKVLLGYLGVRQAADAAAKLIDVKKNTAYKRALELRESSDEDY